MLGKNSFYLNSNYFHPFCGLDYEKNHRCVYAF